MKTTVEIADPLLREAKREAQQAGITLRELIETGLRRVLDERKQAQSKPFKLRDGSVGGGGVHPGIRLHDWRQIRALCYGSRAGYNEDLSLEELDRQLEEEARMEAERDARVDAEHAARARAAERAPALGKPRKP